MRSALLRHNILIKRRQRRERNLTLSPQAPDDADVTDQRVLVVNRHAGIHIVGTVSRSALADNDGGLRRRETAGNLQNTFHRYAGSRGNRKQAVIPQDEIFKTDVLLPGGVDPVFESETVLLDEGFVIKPFADHGVGDAER